MHNRAFVLMAMALLVGGGCSRTDGKVQHVRPASSGVPGGAGGDWNSAYRGFPTSDWFWNNVGPGDTIMLSAGTYIGPWSIKQGGTKEKPVVVTRATNKQHGKSRGWRSAMEGGVRIIRGGIGIDVDNIVIDGIEWAAIHIDVPPVDGAAGIGTTKPVQNLTLRHLQIEGPGWNDTHNVRGMDLTPSNGRSKNVRIEKCEIYNIGNAIYTLNTDNINIQRCRIHHINNEGDVHENVWYSEGCSSGVFRWNTVYRSVAEGVFLRGDQSDFHICGNLFLRSWYGVATKKGYKHTAIVVHNNTFVDVHFPVALKDERDEAWVTNNLFYPAEKGLILQEDVEHDYNWYGDKVNLGEPNGVIGLGRNPFLSASEDDYRLTRRSSAVDRGVGIKRCRKDAFGTERGFDGAWDIGAYERTGDDVSMAVPTNLVIIDEVEEKNE